MTGPDQARRALLCGMLTITVGCDSGIRAKVPAVPAAPAPTSAQPLVLAQTTVALPAPQPVPPDSMPAMIAPQDLAVEPPVPAPRRATPPVRVKPQEPAHAPAPQPQPAGETDGALVSGEDLAKSSARIDARLSDLRRQTRPFANSRNVGKKAAASRVESFLRLADEARKRGDLRQADAMADRAQTLLRELAQQ